MYVPLHTPTTFEKINKKKNNFFLSIENFFIKKFHKIRLYCWKRQGKIFFIPALIFFLLWRKQDKKDNPYIYYPNGVIVFNGIYGAGKSLGAVHYIKETMKKYPAFSCIANQPLDFATPFVDIKQLKEIKSPCIVFIDESQIDFDSREFKKFPIDLAHALSQNRKNKKIFVFASQNFEMVDKRIRLLTEFIVDCTHYKKLWFTEKWYTPEAFEKRFVTFEKRPFATKTRRYVGYPDLFYQFDSYFVLDRLGSMASQPAPEGSRLAGLPCVSAD